MTHPDKSRSPLDRLLAEVGHALRTSFADPGTGQQPGPANNSPDIPLSSAQLSLSAGLMRVNHTGEIAAQALYRGQALVASNPRQRDALLQAAGEEQDHLNWCRQRLTELNDRTSMLAPAWYFGALIIGIAAAVAGDRWSLGFVEETEKQVSAHLDAHLQRLPDEDLRSRRIVAQMREDEARHAEAAHAAGARELPGFVKAGMTHIANLMRFISFRI
jgi:ubiquinone biosynthesis monooxygenase Coq7